VRREHNELADRLGNDALDGASPRYSSGSRGCSSVG